MFHVLKWCGPLFDGAPSINPTPAVPIYIPKYIPIYLSKYFPMYNIAVYQQTLYLIKSNYI